MRRWSRPGIRSSAYLSATFTIWARNSSAGKSPPRYAGSIIGINAFNQPDVEASKIATRNLTTEYEKTGSLPAEKPVLEDGGIKLFTDAVNAEALAKAAGSDKIAGGISARPYQARGAGDYFALLAYIQMNAAHETLLQKLRQALRDRKRVATCLEFGPRFLHSTGQAYKGGPNSGVFLQITCDDAADLPVPGQKYTFGVVKAAQARGDFQVLAERGRRALRVHLGKDLAAGLERWSAAFHQALNLIFVPAYYTGLHYSRRKQWRWAIETI